MTEQNWPIGNEHRMRAQAGRLHEMTEAEIRASDPRPRIYDIATDSFRFATQTDIDNLTSAALAYSGVRGKLRDCADPDIAPILAEIHAELMKNTKPHG